jgi:hypothetical protein
MSLNRLQRIILALTLLVVGVMCVFPPWEASWTFTMAGERVGVCYAPVWSDRAGIVRMAAASELARLQAKYAADLARYESEYPKWYEKEKEAGQKWAEAHPAPLPDSSAEDKSDVWSQLRRQMIPTQVPGEPVRPVLPEVRLKPSKLWNGSCVKLSRERLFLQLGAVVAAGLVGVIVTGGAQVRAAGIPRTDADRIDENSNAGQRT